MDTSFRAVELFDLGTLAACNDAEIRWGPAVMVTTPRQPWAYAAAIAPNRAALETVGRFRSLDVYVSLTVHFGRIGVGCLTADGTAFLAEQQCDHRAEESVARITVRDPRKCGSLILRNTALLGTSSQATVHSVVTREAPLQAGTGNRLQDQLAIVGPDARMIFDVGAHHGASVREYLSVFPKATVIAFEPDHENCRRARAALAGSPDRWRLTQVAVSNADGQALLRLTSKDATHSLLPLGDERLRAEPIQQTSTREVETVMLDTFADSNGIDTIDILKLDIQGAELAALMGASRRLADGRIRVIVAEVGYQQIYAGQSLFWDVGAYLHRFGYGLFATYDPHYSPENSLLLTFADALFVANQYVSLENPRSDLARD